MIRNVKNVIKFIFNKNLNKKILHIKQGNTNGGGDTALGTKPKGEILKEN
jgi:hypothetical protein